SGDGADARGPARAVRDRRAEEVPDPRGAAGRPRRGGRDGGGGGRGRVRGHLRVRRREEGRGGRPMSYEAKFRVWRGDDGDGELVDYTVEVNEGEVVLDIIHRLRATQAAGLAVRWNCKAGKCGSCAAEINGMPRLLCMTRMSTFDPDETVTV